MIHNVFSIYDAAAQAYLPPFILPQVGMAKRIFREAINSDSHQFAKSPADYTLFHLGDFDDSSGKHVLRAHESLGNGVEYVDQPKTQVEHHAEKANGSATKVGDGSSVLSGPSSGDSQE